MNLAHTFTRSLKQTEQFPVAADRQQRNAANVTCRSGLRPGGFTLIELLVVVAIISLLVSILLPSLSAAREKARRIKCAGNVKQMVLAMTMYSDEYNGYYPALLMAGNLLNANWSTWHQLLEPYLQTLKVKDCPTLNLHSGINVGTASFITAYGLNYCGWAWMSAQAWRPNDPRAGFGFVVPGNPRNNGDNPRGGCARDSIISDPSNFIMLGDSNDSDLVTLATSNFTYGILGAPTVYGTQQNPLDMPWRHDDGANIGFTDGHVKWYESAELMLPSAKSMWTRGFE